jgi:hypothetical protein
MGPVTEKCDRKRVEGISIKITQNFWRCEMKSFTDLLNKAIIKFKSQIYTEGSLTDVFTLSDLIQREYRDRLRLYLQDIVIPYIIDKDCDLL